MRSGWRAAAAAANEPADTGHRRSYRGACAVVCGVGLAGISWYGLPTVLGTLKSHPYFAVAQIDVDGNRRLPRTEILQWAGVHEGMSAWDAAPRTLRLRLQQHPWIARVRVQREFPRRVMITVQERHPVAIAQLTELHYVDGSGHLLGPLRDDDSRDLPIITGVNAVDDRFTMIAVHRASQLLRWCARVGCCDALSEVHVDRDRGATLMLRRPAVAVVLGWGSWRDKLARSARVLAAWAGQSGRLAVVDVSFRDLVVVRLRDEGHLGVGHASKRGLRV